MSRASGGISLRGSSAEALTLLRDQLTEAIGRVGSRKTAEVGDDLLGLADVLRSEVALRRTVTDVSVDGEAKQSFVRSLFEGQVDPISVDLLAAAVAQRWTATRDLPDTLEHLGVDTVVRSADDAARVAVELFEVGRLLADHRDLRDTLADPARTAQDKGDLLAGLLAGKTLSSTARLVRQALKGSYRTAGAALEAYQKVAAGVHGESVAQVSVAEELPAADRERLQAALARQYGRPVHLNVVIDPDVIGGIRVEIGDDVIDGTVASRLDDARRRLAG
ncbi:MAG: F0F1 ATP synthase subunit delta [Nocardioides sp.]